jgi:hypothetical protein
LFITFIFNCLSQKPKHASSNKTNKNVKTVTDGLLFLSAVHISQQNAIGKDNGIRAAVT